MSRNSTSDPTEDHRGTVPGAATPGDAGGPDLFGADTGPISAPREAPPEGYHPERSYVGAEGGLGGGDAAGTTIKRTTAGPPARGREGPELPPNWSGASSGGSVVGGDPVMAGSAGAGPAATYLGPADPSETERELVESALEAAAGPPLPDDPTGERSGARGTGEQMRGSAAPEHDAAASPAVEPAGPQGWPLPTGGAPSVTGEPELPERGSVGGGQTPEASMPDLPDAMGRAP